MLNNSSQPKHTSPYIDLDMMLNDARKEERRGRADLMVNRLNILAAKIRHDELSPIEAAELLHQEIERIQTQIAETH
ncbi:DUF2732 family protein [Pantoea sp. S18]|uniref:DUF2732 family protein n=1 Tax=Pantoea sp. S18 TaxID=3019892 RepID=UPI0012ADD98A|nr:DUF2732 family protein [Pantoea sp. S18]MEA5103113.1 DUF2732 family protein [Pantoea sp. S18]MRS20753.1 DUF2732 family protein [Enterobacteriaceae bacterium RIT692]